MILTNKPTAIGRSSHVQPNMIQQPLHAEIRHPVVFNDNITFNNNITSFLLFSAGFCSVPLGIESSPSGPVRRAPLL